MLAGGVPLGLFVLLVAAWGIDSAVSGDRVIRNVSVDGVALGGLSAVDVQAVAADLNVRLAGQPADLTVGANVITTDPVALGARVDEQQLSDDALHARRGGFVLFRPFRWLGTFFTEAELDTPFMVDDEAAAQAVVQLVENQLDDPVEPIIELQGSRLVVVPGADGATLGEDVLAAALPGMLAAGQPYSLELEPEPLFPHLGTADLEAIAADANDATADDVTIQVLASRTEVSSRQLRSWILLEVEDDTPSWRFDEATMIAELRPQFGGLGSEDQQARFEVVDGKPIIIPASESVVCCALGSADRLKDELLSAPDDEQTDDEQTDDDEPATEGPVLRIIELEPEIAGGGEGVAELEALGIIEEVSTFTTNHNCCENRVTNIQLMADIVRGAIIRPGETFSLNSYVGKRTTERGFLPAGAIAGGVIEPQVGGGVSQFTTTIFNAAFFAGIEFVEYQSHSLYFSRYPRGREATISWPKPDFSVKNTTPYGILIWPEYTDTSITVTFYSTKHIEVEDIGRTETSQGVCTRVTTTRQRTWKDGTSDLDSVFAVYRPSEGLDCAGNSTVPTTIPPTTVPGPDDTTPPTTVPEGETTAPPETTATAPPPETTTTISG